MNNFPKNKILISSIFEETTRKGKHTNTFLNIALSTQNLLIRDISYYDVSASKHKRTCSLEDTKLTIFKTRKRQCIKVCFSTATKYYELSGLDKRGLFWKLWCVYITTLNDLFTRPLEKPRNDMLHFSDNTIQTRRKWTDKYLYLGDRRVLEDCDRPKSVPGLDLNDLELFYLKPEYFGCWDQSEHWVQCGDSS